MCLINHNFSDDVLEKYTEITFTSIPGNKYQCQQDESLVVKEKELSKAKTLLEEQRKAYLEKKDDTTPMVVPLIIKEEPLVVGSPYPNMDFLDELGGGKINSVINTGKYVNHKSYSRTPIAYKQTY